MPVPVLAPTRRPSARPGIVTPQRRQAFAVTIADRVGRSLHLDTLGLGGAPYVLRPGVTGLDMPPVQITSDQLPDEDGAILRALRFVERDIFLPIWISGHDHDEQRDRTRTLLSLLNIRKSEDQHDPVNMVDVIVTQPDGTRRVASGWYAGGAEGTYGPGEYGVRWRVLGATIRCLDPYWYDSDPVVLSFQIAPAGKAFLGTAPFFPIRLSPSQVVGARTIDNPGDAPAYMVWHVTGPADSFTAANATTGQSLAFGAAILAGDSITIDTRRLREDVVDQDGTNLFAELTGNPWALAPGPNEVTLEAPGATSSTLVTATVYTRRLGA